MPFDVRQLSCNCVSTNQKSRLKESIRESGTVFVRDPQSDKRLYFKTKHENTNQAHYGVSLFV